MEAWLKNGSLYAGRPSDDNTIFVKGFDTSLGEDGVREALSETFGKYGKVNQVRLPTDRETGELKGIGFIEFENQEAKVSPDFEYSQTCKCISIIPCYKAKKNVAASS